VTAQDLRAELDQNLPAAMADYAQNYADFTADRLLTSSAAQ